MSAIQMRVDIETLTKRMSEIESRLAGVEASADSAIGDASRFLAASMKDMSARIEALEEHVKRFKR